MKSVLIRIGGLIMENCVVLVFSLQKKWISIKKR